jgi:hypothetical protein
MAAVALWWGVRTWFGGIRADSDGVRITNVWFRHYIHWTELRHITIHEESDEGVGEWSLQFHVAGGKRITASYPRGHSGPGEGTKLDRTRLALLSLRADALGAGSGQSDDRFSAPWLDKAQVVSVHGGGRLEPAAVEVAIVIRAPDGRYVHRRLRCSGGDLESGLGDLFAPRPDTLAYCNAPSAPRAVEDHYFESADQALEAAHGQDPPAHPDKWVEAPSFAQFFYADLETKVRPEAARIGMLGHLVAGAVFLLLLAPMVYVAWFLPVWLGISNDDYAADIFGGAIVFAPIPAIVVWAYLTQAFRRHNLAKEKTP